MTFSRGQQLRLAGEGRYVTIQAAIPAQDGWQLFVRDDNDRIREITLSAEDVSSSEVIEEDGRADSSNS